MVGKPWLRAAQQPEWPDRARLSEVTGALAERPPLVDWASCQKLRSGLAAAAAGEAFVLQVGECAELFADCRPERVRQKAEQLGHLAALVRSVIGLPVVAIGRFAGQFAKPRSSPWEDVGGAVIPAYRGDAVNCSDRSLAARQCDCRRLLDAYDHAAAALTGLPDLNGDGNAYVSHEALLLDYEQALVRPCGDGGDLYAGSAHFLWVGERTRQLDHAHIEFASTVRNPIGVKIGPDFRPEEIRALIDKLDPDAEPGRLTLITRFGARAAAERLAAITDAVGSDAHPLLWVCDPMHGNTSPNAAGQKCRVVEHVLAEIATFVDTLSRRGIHPGGLHLEVTPDAVAECVETEAALRSPLPNHPFTSPCDPRLNAAQSRRVVRAAAELVKEGAQRRERRRELPRRERANRFALTSRRPQLENGTPPGGLTDLFERAHLRDLLHMALGAVEDAALSRNGPLPSGGPATMLAETEATIAAPALPEDGMPVADFRSLIHTYARWSVDLAHPGTAGRMQCPPVAASVAAEVVVALLNQSPHVWESGPAAVRFEQYLVSELAQLLGYPPQAAGTLTPGGSTSNLMALLLARDMASSAGGGGVSEVAPVGLPDLPFRPRVLCSEAAHFSIARAAGFVGLGRSAVLRVPVDRSGRMRVDAAEEALGQVAPDERVIAIVGTAGTTDLGAFDPLSELAQLARRNKAWLHVDAAYGGCAVFSRRFRHLLEGIREADSIGLDLHKFGWVPAPASIFLVREARALVPLLQSSTYANPPDDEAAGLIGLLSGSLQTTRRADALKILAAFRALGRRRIEAMVDRCHELAQCAASRIQEEPTLELGNEPTLGIVVFRCRGEGGLDDDELNARVRRRLLLSGRSIVTRARLRRADGRNALYLKLVFLNPQMEDGAIDAVIDDVLATRAEILSE
jgi:L-2,4-diaminobutyrate decarboxylase